MAKAKAMDRTESRITKIEGTPEGSNFLAQYVEADKSLAGMEQYRVLPRFKLIQGMTEKSVRDAYKEGTLLIRPGDAVVITAEDKDGFLFNPHLFWAEAAKWRSLNDKEGGYPIVTSSFNEESELFKKAANPATRFEYYEGQEGKPEKDRWQYRYVIHLRFAGVIYGAHPLAGTPVVLSFERGEHNRGRNFISAIQLRRQRVQTPEGQEKIVKVPLWAQVWKFTTAYRTRSAGGGWWGLDFKEPENPLINASDSEMMHDAYEELRKLHEADRLRVDERDPIENDEAETKAQSEF